MLKGTQQNRDIAYKVFERHGGGNLPAVLAELREEHGIAVSLQTLYSWKREGRWDEKVERPSIEEAKLMRLMGVIERFERQLREAERIEPQEAYAYVNMLGAFFNLLKKTSLKRIDPQRMKEMADAILEAEYGIKRDAEAEKV